MLSQKERGTGERTEDLIVDQFYFQGCALPVCIPEGLGACKGGCCHLLEIGCTAELLALALLASLGQAVFLRLLKHPDILQTLGLDHTLSASDSVPEGAI